MVTYEKRLQQLFHEYQEHIGGPGSLNDAVEWGLATGRIVEPQVDKKAILRADLARALQREKRTDSAGREYRANQSITFHRDGVQESLWADTDLASTSREFMIESFAQRRKAIVDDCVALKAHVDHYNHAHREMEQIPLIIDFTDDVEEREQAARAVLDEAA